MSPTKANRRTTARVVLAIVASTMVLLVLFGSGSIGAVSFAQQSTTTPPNTNPPCRGAQIEWVNPSGDATGGGSEMSNKPETEGQPGHSTANGYHLVAWTSGAPDNPVVEFKYQSGSDPEVTITSSATKIGNDTYEFYWDLSGAPEGLLNPPPGSGYSTISMRAVLYASSGGAPVECDRDTENAVVNDSTSTSQPPNPRDEARAETVEIVYPTNGGLWGVYKGAGFIEVRFSDSTEFLRASYTVTPPGSEPEWKECGTETDTDADDGIECTLEDGDDAPEVTGVAVMANDSPNDFPEPSAQFNDSGDAHRVLGYEQVPTSVTLNNFNQTVPTANAGGDFGCSPTITATVLDQNSRKVAGANVDVHASGPTDNLFFDDDNATNDESDASQPPDKGGHTAESGVDCESSTIPPPFTSNVQGDHDSPTNDTKHIESAPGTNDDGTFSFRLNNRSRTLGTTDVFVFADNDDNDQYCASEPSATTAIGWGGAPTPGAAPTGTTSCPTSSPSTSPSTTSPSPTPTNTTTPPPPPPPVRHGTSVTIDYDGNSFDGKVESNTRKCRSGRRVVLKKQKPGRDQKVGSDSTNRRGRYSIPQRNADGTYYTVAGKKTYRDGSGRLHICNKGRSPNEKVRG